MQPKPRAVSAAPRRRWFDVRRAIFVGFVAGLLAGCAGRAQAPRAHDPSPAAKRIYMAAEARVEQGAYNDGARLLRHALLQLPPDERGDQLRHALILRIAHVELLAWEQTGNAVHLEDAQRMLYRYLGRHEALFGDGKASRAERGEVYEILYEIESRLEAPQSDGSPVTAGVERITEDTPASEPEARTASSRARERASKRTDTSEGDVRVVRVRTGPTVDDPAVRGKLRSRFTDPQAALVLTQTEWVQLHGPRPLVRLAAPASPARDTSSADDRRRARVLGRSLVRAAKPDLQACFVDAFARDPIAAAHSTLEATIDPEGRVTAVRILDGGLDGLGDACVIERVQAVRLDASEIVVAEQVRIPLLFFYQDAVWIHESDGRADKGMFSPPESTSTAHPGCTDAPDSCP